VVLDNCTWLIAAMAATVLVLLLVGLPNADPSPQVSGTDHAGQEPGQGRGFLGRRYSKLAPVPGLERWPPGVSAPAPASPTKPPG
jgi:hypothetical protein